MPTDWILSNRTQQMSCGHWVATSDAYVPFISYGVPFGLCVFCAVHFMNEQRQWIKVEDKPSYVPQGHNQQTLDVLS